MAKAFFSLGGQGGVASTVYAFGLVYNVFRYYNMRKFAVKVGASACGLIKDLF